MNDIINIITRTHREAYFKVCRESVLGQTYPKINHIVGADREIDYHSEYTRLLKDFRVPLFIPLNKYHAPYNLYLNTLATLCKDGWVLAIDDDDCFVNENSLQTIVNNIDNENQLLIWKVAITPHWIVPNKSFGKRITAGDISGIGFMYHTKHNPVDWGIYSYGDYRVAKQLEAKGLEIKWINKVLTMTQAGAHSGR